MHKQFSLFRSHINLAHEYWEKLIQPADIVIDATCGNGHDTLKLCQLAVQGKVYAYDIQEKAVSSTRLLLESHLQPEGMQRVDLEIRCHSNFPPEIKPSTVKLIVYNLGYLPGGNKELTTMTKSTLESIEKAQSLLIPGGAISITCYPGHPEGAIEQNAVVEYTKTLSPKTWNCCLHTWVNRQASPQLLLLQKSN